MSIVAWMSELHALGVRFRREGDQVRCNAPAGALAPSVVSELSRRKSEILAYLDAASERAVDASRSLESPLSFAQQRLWFLQRLDPESAAYNLGAALALDGVLDVSAFESAIDQIVQRHDILRTRIVERDGEPFQVVGGAKVRVLRQDLSGWRSEDRANQVDRCLAEAFARPFDLAEGPLLRVSLLALGEREHVAVFTLHHIVADGWSTGILVREFAAGYAAAVRGARSALPPLAVQYGDYSTEQRRSSGRAKVDGDLQYWTRKLAGAPPVIDLSSDRPRPSKPTQRGGIHRFEVGRETADALRRIAEAHDATPFMVLLTCFATLVRAHAQRDDIPIGVPFVNRRTKAVESLIGLFVNTLVLRADLAGNPTFTEALRRVRTVTLEALDHQDLPFERLVEAIQPERSLAHAPLFQVMFNLLGFAPQSLELPGLAIRVIQPNECTAKVDLTLHVEDQGAGAALSAWFEFSRDLFDTTTVERLRARFVAICEEVTRDPSRPLSRMLGLPPEERARLESWSTTPAPRTFVHLHALFDAQVRRTPDAIAVSATEGQLSFSALRRRSQRVASGLLATGLGPESRIAVDLPRTPDLIAVLLGILRAGAAYVPLDFHHPPERRRHILQTGGVETLVTSHALRSEAHSNLPTGVRVVFLEDLHLSAPGTDESSSDRIIDPDQLAYVLFTSGSTGLPKGVGITHANASALLQWARVSFSAAERAAVLFGTSLCFDLSVFELFLPLCNGGRVVVAETALDLAGLPEGRHLTLLNTVPSVARELEQTGAFPSSLRVVNLAGEALASQLVDRVQRRVPRAIINDLYGPSECTTFSTWARRTVGGPETIGRPVAGTTTRVLDAEGRVAGIALSGELVVGGSGVARGYVGRPDWTAERFVPDAFAATPGSRSYRSGDVARWRPDGTLEYLGRFDHQVKIRGLRIELGDIESALRSHEGVRDACVVVLEKGSEKELCAFVIASSDEIDLDDLHAHLRASIPRYMVPSRIDCLEEFPLNANGKIDRAVLRRLAADAASDRALDGGARSQSLIEDAKPIHLAPRTDDERTVATLWEEMLHVPSVGLKDDFFALGGHSLLAVRMLGRLRKRDGGVVSLRDFFAEPTVVGLARELGKASKQKPRMPAITALARAESYPLSYAQERLWFLSRLEGGPRYVIPVGLELLGELDPDLVRKALREVVNRHEVLRCTFRFDGATPAAFPSEVLVECPVEDLRMLGEAERTAALARMKEQESDVRFELAQGPLFRARLVRLEDRRHVLLLTTHHILCDGASIEVLVREMSTLYVAFLAGEPSPLPPLAIQYSDFARWQREGPSLSLFEERTKHWSDRLRDLPSDLRLPYDRTPASPPTYRGARVHWKLDVAHASLLRSMSRREKTTLFTVTLSAYAALLQRYTGQEDLVIGIPVTGRDREELEPLIGFFVNLTPVRLRRFDGSFEDLVGEARSVVQDALAHADLPFERLAAAMTSERARGRASLVQTVFAFQTESKAEELAPGVTIRLVDLPDSDAKFELTLSVRDDGDRLWGHFDFNADVFTPASVARIASDFETLLAAVAARPSEPLRVLDWRPTDASTRRTDADRHHFRGERALVHELVRAQAAQRPDAIAAVFTGKQITYRALARRAAAWAQVLRDRGVGPEVVVGLAAEPSIDALAAILGILESGGAYLPLDPSYPRQRLAYMLDRARPRIVLVERSFGASMPHHAGETLILEDPPRVSSGLASRAAPPISPSNLAYVIFTSGSTGRPKGIELSHEGLANLVRAQRRAFGLSPSSRVLEFASMSFDASVSEIFTTLCSGATLVLEPKTGRMPGATLRDLVRRESVTTVTLPPSALRVMPHEPLASLSTLIVAGEACPTNVAREWGQGRKLVNAYGPSEVTVCASMGELVDPDRPTGIGVPIEGGSMRVQDAFGRAVPAGALGELFVGGIGVARGYLKDPGLTADRFVPDSEGPTGSRLYATGDRARMLGDGTFEFCGREDDQVKVRGHRVELGEIEARLVAHPSVRAAAVVVQQDPGGDLRLAAYVLPCNADVRVEALWDELRNHLPTFLMPSSLQLLSHWPVTANGKLDRAKLPAPDTGAEGAASAAPRDEWEVAIAGLFGEVLGVDGVGIHDDFFALGGHSLLAVRLVESIRRRFGEYPLTAFLEQPTVAKTAEAMRTGGAPRRPSALSRVVRLSSGPRDDAWIFVHGADGMVARFRELARCLGTTRSIYALQAHDAREGGAPLSSIEATAAAYLDEIAHVVPGGPRCILGFSAGGVIAFEMARRLASAGQGISTLVLLDCLAPGRLPEVEDELETFFSYAAGLAGAFRVDHLPESDEATRRHWRGEFARVERSQWFPLLMRLTETPRSLADEEIEALERTFRVFQSTISAAARYRPGPYAGHTVIVRAETGAARGADQWLGWREHLGNDVESLAIAAGHDAIFSAPHARTLAERLMARCDTRGSARPTSLVSSGSARRPMEDTK